MQTVEYKTLTVTPGFASGMINDKKVEKQMNNMAEQGWVLKAVTEISGPSLKNKDGCVMLTFERPKQ